jgi:lipoprotein-releasing system permease protein
MRNIATAGIALGITVMMLALFIVQGFQNEIRNKIIGFGGHIQVSKFSSNNSFEAVPLEYPAPYFNDLYSIKGIRHIQAFTTKAGIIKAEDAIEGVLFKGVDKDFEWSFFSNQLKKGRLPVFNDTVRSNEILISRTLANRLKLDADSSLIMYFVQDPPRSRKFIISGLYDTGLQESEFDQLVIIGDMRQIQRLNNWEANQVGGVEILIERFNDLEPATSLVYEALPPDLETSSITERYPQIFNWLEMMDTNVVIIISLMLLVGIINMITALLIMILERTSMIGLLKSLGADNRLIRRIFIHQAGGMLLKGMIWGNVMGLILAFVQFYFKPFGLNPETYYVAYVPLTFDWLGLILLNVGVFFICMLAMLLPAMIISRISPAQAMRFT